MSTRYRRSSRSRTITASGTFNASIPSAGVQSLGSDGNPYQWFMEGAASATFYHRFFQITLSMGWGGGPFLNYPVCNLSVILANFPFTPPAGGYPTIGGRVSGDATSADFSWSVTFPAEDIATYDEPGPGLDWSTATEMVTEYPKAAGDLVVHLEGGGYSADYTFGILDTLASSGPTNPSMIWGSANHKEEQLLGIQLQAGLSGYYSSVTADAITGGGPTAEGHARASLDYSAGDDFSVLLPFSAVNDYTLGPAGDAFLAWGDETATPSTDNGGDVTVQTTIHIPSHAGLGGDTTHVFNTPAAATDCWFGPNTGFHVLGRLNAGKDPYPDPHPDIFFGNPVTGATDLPVSWDGSTTGDFEYYGLAPSNFALINPGPVGTYSGPYQKGPCIDALGQLNTPQTGCAAIIDPVSLASLGESVDLWWSDGRKKGGSLFVYGSAYDVGTLEQTSERALDDGSTLTPADGTWTATHGALSLASGIRIDGTGETAPALNRSYSVGHESRWYTHRYLHLQLTADADMDRAKLEVREMLNAWGGYKLRRYSLPALSAGVLTAVSIDLMSPAEYAPGGAVERLPPTDATATILPLPPDCGPYWGAGIVSSFTLLLPDDCILTVGSVSLAREDSASVSMTAVAATVAGADAPLVVWDKSFSAGGVRARPYLLGNTDGRRSLEVQDVELSLFAWSQLTLQQLFDRLNKTEDLTGSGVNMARWPGWTLTAETVFAHPTVWNLSRPATWLGGAGLMYVDGAWTPAFELDVSSALTLRAQFLYKQVNFYAGCGDVFGISDSHYGGSAEIRMGRVLRGEAEGIVLDSSGDPASGVTVSVTQDDTGADSGSGTTDARGRYLTGLPHGRADHAQTVKAHFPNRPSAANFTQWYRRWRHRASFRLPAAAFGPLEVDSVRAWLYTASDRAIARYHDQDGTLAEKSDDHPVIAWVRFRTDERTGRIWGLALSSFVDSDLPPGGP